MDPVKFRSSKLPGGDFVSALFDREVMSYADRGLASNLIGDRWADLAAAHAELWPASGQSIPTSDGDLLPIVRVDRLDATPRIAAAASRNGLQNPDFLLVGRRENHYAVQAADAKFSIETARAKQVSPEVVSGLLGLREVLPELLPGLDHEFHIEPGIFLAPDYPLTHLMLQQDRRARRGILRTTVHPDEVVLVPVAPGRFWEGVEGASLMNVLAQIDGLPLQPEDSLLSGLYYFRLARGVIGFWLDATKPLLQFNDALRVDEPAIVEEAKGRGAGTGSAIDVIRRWDADVESVRGQRAAVEQVAGLPIPGRELRSLTAELAKSYGGDAPSANQVRRRLGAWFRGALRERLGPILPPVDQLTPILRQIAAVGRELAPKLELELEHVVHALISEAKEREATNRRTVPK